MVSVSMRAAADDSAAVFFFKLQRTEHSMSDEHKDEPELSARARLAQDLRFLADKIDASHDIDQVTIVYRVGFVDGEPADSPVYVSHIFADWERDGLDSVRECAMRGVEHIDEDIARARRRRRPPEV